MALTKYKLGELISLCDDRNSEGQYTLDDLKGISIKKEFIETKADMEGVSLTPYILVRPDSFAYVTVTSRNGEKITLAHNTSNNTYIVSSSYVVFRVKRTDILLSDYLFMYFNRPEFDRYSRFNSWGSARETFSWDDMCGIDITLPSIEQQQKFVNVYLSLKKNYATYQSNVEDLKVVCDAYIENLRKSMPCERIGQFLHECNDRNVGLKVKCVQGVESSGNFTETRANTEGLDFTDYKIVRVGQFAYNPSRINLGSIALRDGESCIVSPMYVVFEVSDTQKLDPEYLYMWLSRSEFLRSTLFYAIGSVRDTFDFSQMEEVLIPIPDIDIQRDIVKIHQCYVERQRIAAQLKGQLNNLCPILIKGSLQSKL